MENSDYLDSYEKRLENGLLKVCEGLGVLNGEMILSPDLEDKWDLIIKDYIADAVENFNDYPEVVLAWAGFLGMGVAHHWDEDWHRHKSDSYASYYGPRGYDDMDEYILHKVLGLGDDDCKRYSDIFDSCALAALGLMKHEGIQAQTAEGFYILARSYSVFFRLGASIELKRLGWQKVCKK